MSVGTTDNDSVVRKVVSEIVIMVVHLDIVNVLKKITNPETDLVLTSLKQFYVVHVLCFHLFGSDIEFVLVFTSIKCCICMVQNTTSNLISFSL